MEQGHTIGILSKERLVGTGTLLGSEIMGVFVHPESQGNGYGKEIMRHFEEKALASGMNDPLSLDASVVSKTSMGYSVLRHASIDVGNDQKLAYYQMEKRL